MTNETVKQIIFLGLLALLAFFTWIFLLFLEDGVIYVFQLSLILIGLVILTPIVYLKSNNRNHYKFLDVMFKVTSAIMSIALWVLVIPMEVFWLLEYVTPSDFISEFYNTMMLYFSTFNFLASLSIALAVTVIVSIMWQVKRDNPAEIKNS